MVKVKSNFGDAGKKWTADIEKKVREAVIRAAQRTALVGEARVRGIIEREAYDTGELLRSVQSMIESLPNEIAVKVTSSAAHAIDVEYGRLPGKWPNLDALVAWTARKLKAQGINTRVNITFDALKAMARSNGKKATKQQQAYRAHLAFIFLVGRKIATKGIRQKLIFKRVEDGLKEFFRREIVKELKKVL